MNTFNDTKTAIFQHLRTIALGSAMLVLANASAQAQTAVWKDVFNGKDLTGLQQRGNGNVKVVDGMIEVSGGNGYLYTEKDYSRYKVKVEWKNVGGGNSGFLFHVDLNKHECGNWPSGLEMQFKKDDVGSIWTTDSKFDSTGEGDKFSEQGAAIAGFGNYGCGRRHFFRTVNQELIGEWNTWEMHVDGSNAEAKVNGVVVMRVSNLTTGGNVPLVRGKMALQIEGSQVLWRNWQVMELGEAGK
jgi:hypothetical protein